MLKNVLWIGGATDAGKTTVADMLAEKHNLAVYHGDKRWRSHWTNITPEEQPAMFAWDKMNMDERWVNPSVQALTELTLQIMHERWPLIIKDLNLMSHQPIIVAEWFGLLPKLVAPLLENIDQALWIFPTDTFKDASIKRRGKSEFHMNTSNPEKAWDNHLKRDLKLAEIIKRQTEVHRVHSIVNNGTYNMQEMLTRVEAYFGSYLNKSS
jgi:hypothetical protein